MLSDRAMRPRAILFDLDDTLIQAYPRPEAAWLAVTREHAVDLGRVSPEEAAAAILGFAQAVWADAERFREHRHDLAASRRRIVAGAFGELRARGRPAPPPQVAERIADRFSAYRIEQMRLHEGAHETLDALRDRGVALALVTNGDGPGQRAKLERFALGHRFDHLQIEGEHGFGKPEPQAYRFALHAVGAAPHEAWMVGDNLEWEVAAPQRLGLHAIWCDHAGEGLPQDAPAKPNRIVRKLAELLDWS
jgi:putative hydrolase of the HAD superfamily